MGVEAGVREEEYCPNEIQLGNLLGRVSFINGISFLSYLIAVLENLERYKDYSFNAVEETYLLMFHYTVWGDSLAAFGINTLYESLVKLYDNRPIFEETLCVLKYNYAHLSSMSKEDDALEE